MATIWTRQRRDEGISLGGDIGFLKAFANLAKVAGEEKFFDNWSNLAGIVTQEQSGTDADPEWLADVREEAKEFLREYGPHRLLTDDARLLLQQLS